MNSTWKFRLVALLGLAPLIAWLFHHDDAALLLRIQRSPADFLAYEQRIHGHSYGRDVASIVLLFGLLFLAVEGLAAILFNARKHKL